MKSFIAVAFATAAYAEEEGMKNEMAPKVDPRLEYLDETMRSLVNDDCMLVEQEKLDLLIDEDETAIDEAAKVCSAPCGAVYTGVKDVDADANKKKWAIETALMSAEEKMAFYMGKAKCMASCGLCTNYPKPASASGASALAMGAALVAATVALM